MDAISSDQPSVVICASWWYLEPSGLTIAQGTMVPHYITLPSPDVICMDFKNLSYVA